MRNPAESASCCVTVTRFPEHPGFPLVRVEPDLAFSVTVREAFWGTGLTLMLHAYRLYTQQQRAARGEGVGFLFCGALTLPHLVSERTGRASRRIQYRHARLRKFAQQRMIPLERRT